MKLTGQELPYPTKERIIRESSAKENSKEAKLSVRHRGVVDDCLIPIHVRQIRELIPRIDTKKL